MQIEGRISDIVCPEREGLPIDGALKEPEAAANSQSGSRPPKFALLPLGRVLKCGAGNVEYKVQMTVDNVASGDPVATSLKLRPVYQLAATFAVGFDPARPPSYSVVDKKISEDRNHRGPQLYGGFIW